MNQKINNLTFLIIILILKVIQVVFNLKTKVKFRKNNK